MAEHPVIARLNAVSDPAARARACQEFLTNGRATLRQAQQLRDAAIRAARAPSGPTVDALAAAVGVRRNVVVDALRARPRRRAKQPR